MSPRADGVRDLPFRQAFRVAKARGPWSFNSLTTGLAGMALLWLVHLDLALAEDVEASLLGLVLLPIGLGLVVWGWVYSRVLMMALGLAVGFVGAAGPFWIMNAR